MIVNRPNFFNVIPLKACYALTSGFLDGLEYLPDTERYGTSSWGVLQEVNRVSEVQKRLSWILIRRWPHQ